MPSHFIVFRTGKRRMEVLRISSGFYRPRVRRLSNIDLRSVHGSKSVNRSQSQSVIKVSRISSGAYKPRVIHVNKNDLPTANQSKTLKREIASTKRLSHVSSFHHRHRITPMSNNIDSQSICQASSISFKTEGVSLSRGMT